MINKKIPNERIRPIEIVNLYIHQNDLLHQTDEQNYLYALCFLLKLVLII